MEIPASLIKELREKTGAGIMECKKALTETNCDIEDAVTYLREKGLAKAGKRADKVASEGLVLSYIHGGGKIGVLVEVNCETDFVARTEGFAELVKDIAMQIAAMNPFYIRRSDIPQDVVEREKEVFKSEARESGKPEGVIEKIAEGKLEKFFKEACLLEQAFVKDQEKTVEELLNETIAKIGEKISVRRFARYKVGEGIEKKSEEFSREVAATLSR